MKIDECIKRLTLEEKASQLYQAVAAYLKETTAANTGLIDASSFLQEQVFNVGSILNFADAKEMKEISNLCIQGSSAKIPPMFMLDVVHGCTTIYPIPLAMAGTFDTGLVETCCEMAARESVVGGIQATFAPMVDLVRDPRWGRVMESAGEDPFLNGVMGRAQIRGFKKGGLISCVKHFAAYGAAEAGRDYNTTDISDYSLYNFYLTAYEECVKEQPEMVMTSFNLLNGVPVNGHSDLLIDLLRNQWGFDGVVISDYNGVTEMIVHGYAEDEERCAEIALNNEIDIEMVSPSYIRYLPKLVKEGRVSEEKIDRMLRRVLELKKKAGLFENPYGRADVQLEETLGLCREYRDIARQAAERAIVLLKNNSVLPLRKTNKISLVGHMAQEKNVMGEWHCRGKKEDCVSVFEGIGNLLGFSPLDMDGEITIACIGEKSEMSGEASSKADIRVSQTDVALVKELHQEGKKVVAVVFAGRPLVMTEIEPYCDAIVYAWFLGTESGNAIARVLFGEVSPSAKLTMSFPRSVGQCPIYYNHFNTGRPKARDDYFRMQDYCSCYQDEFNLPLYPFGYGLTYTNMTLSGLTLSADTIRDDEKVIVSVLLENNGAFDGEEVVQLYIRDKFASVVRPVKELKAYQKVKVPAGQKEWVEFTLSEEMLRYYRNKNERVSENGEFEVMVGLNSKEVLVAKLFKI